MIKQILLLIYKTISVFNILMYQMTNKYLTSYSIKQLSLQILIGIMNWCYKIALLLPLQNICLILVEFFY